MNRVHLTLPLALFAALPATAQGEASPESIAQRHKAELAAARTAAKVHNKRVLILACPEGQDLQKILRSDRQLSRKLLYEFEVVQFAGGQLAKPYLEGGDSATLTVESADGKRMMQFGAAEFVVEQAVDGVRLEERLRGTYCEPVDAELKLQAALAEAKQSGRAVFIRFDAPW